MLQKILVKRNSISLRNGISTFFSQNPNGIVGNGLYLNLGILKICITDVYLIGRTVESLLAFLKFLLWLIFLFLALLAGFSPEILLKMGGLLF